MRNIKDEAEKKTAMDKWFAEDLKNWVSLAEKSLPAGPGPFLVPWDEKHEPFFFFRWFPRIFFWSFFHLRKYCVIFGDFLET